MTRRLSTIGVIAAALVLVVTAVTTQAQPQFAGTWTLSPDGRTLTINTVMHSARGDKTMKTVYLKG